MVYKLGLTISDRIKGIAAIVANIPDSASCDCTLAGKALPVLIINGTAENVNPLQRWRNVFKQCKLWSCSQF